MMPSTRPFASGMPAGVDEALKASAAGDAEAAIALFRSAIAQSPDSAVARFLFAAELAQSGATAEAEAQFAGALLLAPQFHIARFQLGLLQFTAGRAALAMLTWQPLRDLGEADALGCFVRGFAALADERVDEALAAFAAGIQRNTANEPLNADMRMVMQRIEAGAQASAPAPAAGDGVAEDTGAHVLLSNYRSQAPH